MEVGKGDGHSPCLSVSRDTLMWAGLDKRAYLSIRGGRGAMCRRQEGMRVMGQGLGGRRLRARGLALLLIFPAES